MACRAKNREVTIIGDQKKAQGPCPYKCGQGMKRVGPPYRLGPPDVMVLGKNQIAGVPITIVVLDDEPRRICSHVRGCMTKSRHVCKTLQPACPHTVSYATQRLEVLPGSGCPPNDLLPPHPA
jgi:hypothetical protein